MTTMARGISPKMARLMANMYYVGGIAHLLGIDEGAISSAVERQFRGKENAITMNLQAISEARSYASENWGDVCKFAVMAREKSSDTFLIEGNEAVALGCIYGGINMLSWYPITPSSSLAESIINWIPKLRKRAMVALRVLLYKLKTSWRPEWYWELDGQVAGG